MRHIVAWMVIMPLLLGCSMTRAPERAAAPVTAIKATPVEMLTPKKGSIWQSTDRNTLFLDNKARNVGDIVTVVVSENARARKNAATNLSRDGSSEMDLGSLFGLSQVMAGKYPNFDTTATITGKHEHQGTGTTSRDGTLTATVSCQVTEVLPNGNLRIEGRRDITVNYENQYIILSGVVRPEDITQNNTVASAQIADARIDYSGEGDVDDQQRPSWFNRLLAAFRVL